ncbi:ATP-binding cassette domain-containing protein [Candidatus Babeliales bacterium]|nr:ATP-binding cassette domain-containing protein [Candidatus Babeliales bacterium]
MLTVRNLSQTIQGHKILKSVSLSMEKGKVTALLGPNGAGKTTLLKTIMGLYPTLPIDKEKKNNAIFFNSNLVNNWSTGKRVAAGISYLPQQTSLFQQLSVLDNLALVYQYHPFWQEKPWEEFLEQANSWRTQVGLTSPDTQKTQTLSGGQKRKLEVIRTILMKPKVAMFDEPFAGVDPKSIYELKEIFSQMAEQDIAVVISDHNVDQLLSIAEQIYVVLAGEIATSGGIKDILNDQTTKHAYFGSQFYSEISQRFSN